VVRHAERAHGSWRGRIEPRSLEPRSQVLGDGGRLSGYARRRCETIDWIIVSRRTASKSRGGNRNGKDGADREQTTGREAARTLPRPSC
jgi:hypothetical protein